MQPSKEREASDGDPMDDLDDLLDDDLADDEGSAVADESVRTGDATTDPATGSADGDGGRIGTSGRWFSAKAFLLALATVGVGVFVGGSIPLIGGIIGSAAGVFLAAFLVGSVLSSRKYVETGIAGTVAGAGAAVTSVLGIGFLPVGIDYLQEWGLPLLAVGGGVGLVLALLGHYFGRDLRAGLTEDIGS